MAMINPCFTTVTTERRSIAAAREDWGTTGTYIVAGGSIDEVLGVEVYQ